MLNIKSISFNYRGSPNGCDVVVVELNDNIDEAIIINSWRDKMSVPTSLGVLYFDVSLNKNVIHFSTSDKNKFNDAISGSSESLKNSIKNFVETLNNRIRN